jgi:hypothetical protein
MKLKEVVYERKFNLGNYETETIGVAMVVDEGDKFADVLSAARKAVMASTTAITRPQSSATKDLNLVLESKRSTGS